MARDRCRQSCSGSAAPASPARAVDRRAENTPGSAGNQRLLTKLRTEGGGGQKLFQRAGSGARVSVRTTGTCSDTRALAEALPGARAMVDTAVGWFTSVSSRDQARVSELMRANFLSDSDRARITVESRLLRMRELLTAGVSGRLTFDCVPGTNPDCVDNNGFVMTNDRSVIHLCPSFFGLTLEGRRWTLVHESAHAAGAIEHPEFYYGTFGPFTAEHCLQETRSASPTIALGHADNYARLVWCLTRPAGRVVTPP
jgi:hypothetical protein